MKELPFLCQNLYFIQKSRVASQLRVQALRKLGKKCELTEEAFSRYKSFEDWMNKEMRSRIRSHPAYPWFSKVKGIGDLNIGKVVGFIDIQKAENISKLWRYAGFGVIEGKRERPKEGERLHYNKRLKTMCWRLGKSLIRAAGPYYHFYKEQKKKITEKLKGDGIKIIPSAKLPKDKRGKKYEPPGTMSVGHVDFMATRKMIKLFLSHLWIKWREAEGLKVTMPYAHDIMGHTDYVDPDCFIEKAILDKKPVFNKRAGGNENSTLVERARLKEKPTILERAVLSEKPTYDKRAKV